MEVTCAVYDDNLDNKQIEQLLTNQELAIDELVLTDTDISVTPITTINDMPNGWNLSDIPYVYDPENQSDEELSIGDILNYTQEQEERNPKGWLKLDGIE